jgi:uncharacterized protein (DUF2236 family)
MLEQFMERRVAPRWWPPVMKKYVWPWLAARRQIVVNCYPAHVKDLFGLEWTPEDEDMSRRFMHMYRRLSAVVERFVPLRLLYLPIAARGFEREGIDPRAVTLESAQRTLRESRARWAAQKCSEGKEEVPTPG